MSRIYSAHATLVLVGFHGAGKKTLGIIASVALRRRFIDFNTSFQQEFGLSPQEYIATYGLARYRTVDAELSHRLLKEYDKGCVITGLGGVASSQQQAILRKFAQDHPVVYVRRDESDLRHLVSASDDRFERFVQAGNAFFEACSNFEFFNLTLGDVQQYQGRLLPASLKLKEAERLFVRFLGNVYGRPNRTLLSSDAFSPSQTLALQVPLWWLDSMENWEALDAGADAINLIVNIDEVEPVGLQKQLARRIALLRMHSRVPTVVDIRLADHADSNRYYEVLEMALRLAPDAVTCPISCSAGIIQRVNATKGNTKAIATYYQPAPLGSSSQSSNVYTLPKKAQELGFQSIRMIGESAVSDDNLACVALRQSLVAQVDISLSVYNAGTLGRTSICLNPVLSPVILPKTGCTGVTLPEVQRALTACFMRPKKHFTIIGQAVRNSLSPVMHNTAYAACGLPHFYDTLEPRDFSQVQALLDSPNHAGLAISLSYKSAIVPFLDEICPEARRINAVNTVVLERQYQDDGTETTIRKGYNTDYIGVQHCIQKHLSPANAVRDGTTALIIGAGGMARAAIYACYELGVRRIAIYNRTSETAEALARYYHKWAAEQGATFHLQVIHSASEAWPAGFRLPTIVVSCLPGQEVGSTSLVDLRISKEWLQSTTGGVCLEVAYGPFRTTFLDQVLEYTSTGWVVVDGLSLLIEQGIAQYELFTKRPAPVHVMRRLIQEEAVQFKLHVERSQVHTTQIRFRTVPNYHTPSIMTPAYQPAIMSASLGRAWAHDLDHKITSASAAGFKGIEIFYEDLEYLARKLSQSATPTHDELITAASHIYASCHAQGLEIIGLQPFLFYEGLKDREQHERLIKKMKLWLQIAKALHTTIIQIPANFLPAEQLVYDLEIIAADLREVADLGAAESPVVRFAYENLCWSTHVDTVEKLWDVVQRVNRPNFGICLDTFNIAGRVWGDPGVVGGKMPKADEDLKATLEKMVKDVDVSKVFYIQVVDAERLASPLVQGHEFHVDGQPARMSWSRNARTFMYETDRGAYLPTEKVARAIISELGYKGYISMELFSRSMNEEGAHVPKEHAERGIRAWEKFEQRLHLN
ncbi:hypothetical protein BJX63DRAFT_426463 [Aspergillus granulosus]|uniref:Quinate repressor protein n=1 Tax=Aspergillus granulosus TaxID=176169 RepID=A0ABR4GS31_9EURO